MSQPLEAIAIAAALAGQVFAGAWWASGVSEKINNISLRQVAVDQHFAEAAAGKIVQADRLARIEEHIIELSKTAGEIKSSLASRHFHLDGRNK